MRREVQAIIKKLRGTIVKVERYLDAAQDDTRIDRLQEELDGLQEALDALESIE